jgi:hypothetical protein
MRLFVSSIALLVFCTVSACTVSRSQTNSNQTVPEEMPSVTVCELLQNPERFHQKVVRVTATYENAFEQSFLFDPSCKRPERDGPPEIWVNFDKSFVRKGESEEAKKNAMISGMGFWNVTAVGRFVRGEGPQRFGHLGCCRYQFEFMKIEKSEKLPDKKQE